LHLLTRQGGLAKAFFHRFFPAHDVSGTVRETKTDGIPFGEVRGMVYIYEYIYKHIEGQGASPMVSEKGGHMKIAIVGSGCDKCNQTAEVVRRAVALSGVDAEIHKVEDMREIMKFRVMKTPAVAIDGKVKVSGRIPTVEEITSLLTL
jgi:small redox-active disulfide protein 2